MLNTFDTLALRRDRAQLAGEIEAAQRALMTQLETLATLDAVIRLFEPEADPGLIPAGRPCPRRGLFFRALRTDAAMLRSVARS